MEFYWTIHISMFISCILFYMISKKSQKYVMLIWCLILTIIGGIRWKVGGDIEQYYDHFLCSKWSNIFNYDRYGNGAEKLEPGFVFVNVLIKTLFKEFYFYNLIICAFVEFSIYKFCREFFPQKALLVFLLMQEMGVTYMPVRAGLATGICYWAWKFIKEQRLKEFLIVVFCATIIHNKSIILLPCYWIGRRKFKPVVFLLIYPIIAAFSYVFQDVFTAISMSMGGSIAEKAYMYTQNETDGFTGASYIGWALNYFFLIVYLYLRKIRHLENDLWYNTLLNIVMFYNAIFMVFSNGMGDLVRLSGTYLPAQIILLFYSIFYYWRNKKSILSIAAMLFYFSYCLYKLSGAFNGYFFETSCVPYKTIFDYKLVTF